MARSPGYSEPLKADYQQTASEVVRRDAPKGQQEVAPEIAAVDEPHQTDGSSRDRASWSSDARLPEQERSAIAMDRRVNARFAAHNAEIALERSGSGEPAAEPGDVKAEEHETAAAGGG